ncbi:MAG: peroxiredoxin [Lautropia sp.]|nr:peroxiredoxin [Lautropia sp.]
MSTPVPTVALGEPVEDFEAITTDGPIRLSSLQGRMVVLYFYPKDNTPGCSIEGADFAAEWKAFLSAGAEVFGVSRDSLTSHNNFKRKLSLPFALISDPEETLCRQFDVIRQKNMYGKQVQGIERSTFLINREGVLVKAWRKVKVPGHVEEVLKAVQDA